MTARDDAIKAGIEALYTGRAAQGYKTPLKTLVTCVVDAVEPLIRADERAAIHKALDAEKSRWEAEIRADERERMALDLRQWADQLREQDVPTYWIFRAAERIIARGEESDERADERERLREQVAALEVREPWGPAGAQMIDRAQVLRLLGGGSDG